MNVNFHVKLGRNLWPFTSKIKDVRRGIKNCICHLSRNIFLNISVTRGGMTLKIYLKVKRDERISKKKNVYIKGRIYHLWPYTSTVSNCQMAHQNWKCPTEMKSKGHLTHWEQETFVKHWCPLPSPTYENMLHLHVWRWPTDLNIDRDHLLIKSCLPTKFEGSGADCIELSVA